MSEREIQTLILFAVAVASPACFAYGLYRWKHSDIMLAFWFWVVSWLVLAVL